MGDNEDCWDAFGSENEQDESGSTHEQGALWLTQHFLRWNPQISLSQRRVLVLENVDEEWTTALEARGIKVNAAPTKLCDAAIVATSDARPSNLARRNVVPNGVLMMVASFSSPPLDERVWTKEEIVCVNVTARIKHACPINEASCPWLPSLHDVNRERRLLGEATVTRSAHEIATSTLKLTEHDLQRASMSLTKYGYCVVRSLVDEQKGFEWGSAVLSDLQQAAGILKERDGIEIKSPGVNTTNYRELAMREDLRMDLRDGPHLRTLRQEECKHYSAWGIASDANPSEAIVTSSSGSYDSCLRFHPDILEICKRTMNPKDPLLYKGNFGRYNFDGSGPDGSYQPLRIGPMGGIVSLPGSADQALHADTPHLFEYFDCLPAHYINAFCLGADLIAEKDSDGCFTGSTAIGGTVFIHNSHRLSFTAEMEEPSEGLIGNAKLLRHMVRPSLQLGDVVLFDCRLLHFGLANTSQDVERPLLYTNITHAWFHDPKNWSDRQSIFDYTKS